MKKAPEVTESFTVPPEVPKIILKEVGPIVAKKAMEFIQKKVDDKKANSKRKPHRRKKKSQSLFPQSKKRRR